VANNTPYDKFAREILTAGGSNRENPAASYFKILRDPANTMENTTHLFLAVRFNCNKCHDHPFERWTQDQYYQTAAYFAQIDLKADPMAKGAVIGATAVEKGKPTYEIVADMPKGEMLHERTGLVAAPQFPFPAKHATSKDATRREELAAWMTSPDNMYFARSYVNRLWGYMFGVGIMEPIDDIRAGNPPSNPELLEYLTQEFIDSGFNVRHVIQLICKSRTYQLSVATNQWNVDDKTNYSHATARRLPAEVLYDAIHRVTGSVSSFPGYPAGTRAAELADVSGTMGAGFLQTFGRPARESACECERAGGMALGPVMAMISGPTLADAIADPKNALVNLVQTEQDDAKLIDALFVRVLNRPATKPEIDLALATMKEIDADHAKLSAQLAEREAWWKPVFAQLEKERASAIAAAKQALAAYEKASAPAIAAAEKKRIEGIAAAEAALATAERRRLYDQAAWEAKLAADGDKSVVWQPLKITEASIKGNASAKFTIENDGGNVFVTASDGTQGSYLVSGETSMQNVTAVMLEVLPDERIDGFGPGLKSRNFVLTEFSLVDSETKGKKAAKARGSVKFADAIASYTQDKFDVKQAIDGKRDAGQQNGWAIGGPGGIGVQRAVFSLEKPLVGAEGQKLSFDLSQVYKPGFLIGKFRLWVTDAAKPLDFGLPAAVAAVVKKPADKRTAADWATLDAHQKTYDAAYAKSETALWTARLPLPVDSKLAALKDELTQAEQPVPTDPQLLQLRADAQMSRAQTVDKRLTVVQDLAWALMNSPAFLFNR